ncbi:MAG TPA: insulinase family protein [Rectinemataceae bacterium]|nr:insulinase family protein [Rectinemataceae bacterium]
MKTTKTMNRSFILIAALMVLLVLSGPVSLSAQAISVAASTPEPIFVRDNLPTFVTLTLSNGIPVYIKQNKANRVRNINLVLRGSSLVAPPEQAGWSKLAFATMARASANYSYETVTELLDSTSSSILAGSQFEYSTLSLNVLDKYFDRLLPIWSDMIVSPGFASPDFDQAKNEVVLAIQSKDQNPWAVTNKMTNEKYFVGHPYAVNADGTEATIGLATIRDMKTWYDENVSADRIFIVAVGDFDVAVLGAALENSIGKVPNRNLRPIPAPPRFRPWFPRTALHSQSRPIQRRRLSARRLCRACPQRSRLYGRKPRHEALF